MIKAIQAGWPAGLLSFTGPAKRDPELRDAIPRLQRFEAMCVGPAFNSEMPVIVNLSPP